MCVVETKDAEQANFMKNALMEKYDHLTITSTGAGLGVEDTSSDSDSDIDSEEEAEIRDKFQNLGNKPPMPRSPMTQRKRIDSVENKVGGGTGLSIPVISGTGRRGSMMVQTHVKTPEWKTPDIKADKIDWSNRGTHYPVHSSASGSH